MNKPHTIAARGDRVNQEHSILHHVRQQLDLPAEIIPMQTQIVLDSNREVTVHGHRGIGTYAHQEIRVRIRGGFAVIRGEHLEISRMNPARIVIQGHIEGIELEVVP